MMMNLQNIQLFLNSHQWLIRPAALMSSAFLLTYLVYIFYKRIQPALIRSKNFVISALVEAIQWPLLVAIWSASIISMLPIFTPEADKALAPFVSSINEVGFILLVTWVFIRFIRIFEEELLLKHFSNRYLNESVVQTTGMILRIVAVIFVGLLILPILGIPISGIVAFGGGSAIIAGIGAQQILANYFGGIIVYSERNFKVGDWVYSPDRTIEGVVEYIGWRVTTIRTFDKRLLYVPNAAFLSIIVINASRMKNRRIKEIINIQHTDAGTVENIIKDMRSMLQAHPDLDHDQSELVHFIGFTDFSISLQIYVFTRTKIWEEYLSIQQDIFLRTTQIIEQNGAQLARRLVEKI